MSAANYRKTYRSRRPLKIFFRALLIAILALIVLAVVIFFGFRKYIVYTPEGVKLDIPILREDGVSASPGSSPGTTDIILEIDTQ